MEMNDFKNEELYYAYLRGKKVLNNCTNVEEFYKELDEMALDKETKLYKKIDSIEKSAEKEKTHGNLIGVENYEEENSYNWSGPIIYNRSSYNIYDYDENDNLVKYRVDVVKFHIGLDVRAGYTNKIYFASMVEEESELSDFEEFIYNNFYFRFEYDRFSWDITLYREDGYIEYAFSTDEKENEELSSFDSYYYTEYPDYFEKAYCKSKGF